MYHCDLNAAEQQRRKQRASKTRTEIRSQELICKGWFLPPNTYDCGSFVVN